MRVGEFIWPRDRVEHIAKHGVEPSEVEDVCFGEPLIQRAKSEGAHPVDYVLGQTSAGKPTEARGQKEMKSQRIPEIDSIEELAQFWDTHDLTDFQDDLEVVTKRVFIREESVTVPVKLNPEDVQALKRIAESEGVAEQTLLRRWVRERLRKSS